MIPRPDHEHVGLSRGEGIPLPILDGHDRKRSVVLLDVFQGAHATGVVSAGDHDHGSNFELVNVGHFAGGDVYLDGVVDCRVGIGETEGASVVGDGHGHLLGGHVSLLNTAELVGRLALLNAMEDESSLGIVEQTKEIAGLFEGDHVHETGGIIVIRADLAVDLDAAFHADLLTLLAGEGVLETLAKDDGDGEAFALFVGALGGFGGPDAAHFAEVPVAGGVETLQVLLGSARPL